MNTNKPKVLAVFPVNPSQILISKFFPELRILKETFAGMSLQTFQNFVTRHSEWFQGYNPESVETLQHAEQELAQSLPISLKWLLSQYGYWKATGVGGLPFMIGVTQAFRPQFPHHWIILARPSLATAGPPGFVILIASPQTPLDGAAVLLCDGAGHILRRYSGFSRYVMALQHELQQAGIPFYQSCLPSFHRNETDCLDGRPEFWDIEEFQTRVLETILYNKLTQDLAPPNLHQQTSLIPTAETATANRESWPVRIRKTEISAVRIPTTRILAEEISPEPVFSSAAPSTASPPENTTAECFFENGNQNGNKSEASLEEPALTSEFRADDSVTSVLSVPVRRRREFLLEHALEISPDYRICSSSRWSNLRSLRELPEGYLLLAVEDSAEHHWLGQFLSQWGTTAEWQIVTRLDWPLSAPPQPRLLIFWIAAEQFSALSQGYFHYFQATPHWIMEAGESLQELLPRILTEQADQPV